MSDRSRPRPARVTVTLAVVAAVIATVLLLDDSTTDDPTADAASPASVSAEEFCAAFEKVRMAHAAILTAPTRQATQDVKDAATALGELLDGTEMSDEARAGARLVISLLLELGDVATAGEINTFDEQATLQDTANAKALGVYVADTCVPPAPTNPK